MVFIVKLRLQMGAQQVIATMSSVYVELVVVVVIRAYGDLLQTAVRPVVFSFDCLNIRQNVGKKCASLSK